MKRLYIPDLHFPFCNMALLEEVYKFNKTFRADEVYQLGDFVDQYNFTRFVKSPSAPSLTQELDEAKKQIKQFAKWFPRVTILQGNHERRLAKRASEAGIPDFILKGLPEILDMPKGLVYHDKDYKVLDEKTIIAHGHLTSENAKKTHSRYYQRNTVVGHIHNQLGVEFDAKAETQYWGMSCSCIVDKTAVAFAYAQQDWRDIICGFGYEDNGKPHVVRLG